MKVLYVVDTLKRRAGITSFITTYINKMISDEVQIDILALKGSESEIVDEFQKIGCKVYLAPYPSSINCFIQYINFVNTIISNETYDIIHSHFIQGAYVVFKSAKKNNVKHLIMHSHNTRLSDSKIKAIINRMLLLPVPKMVETWAACSKEAGVAMFGKRFLSSGKSMIIRNAIDVDRFIFNAKQREAIRNKYGLEGCVLGFVGGFRKQKNIIFLLDVFKCLLTEYPSDRYTLLLVGSGEEKKEIEKRINELNISDNVKLLGPRNDVNLLLNAMDVFVLPSLYEGLGLVLIEAQSNGLFCLASNNVPLESKVSDRIQYISIKDGVEKWVEAIIKLKENNTQQRLDYAEKVRKAGFDINEEASRIKNVYEAMLK